VDTLTPHQRSVRMGLIRGHDTRPELSVRRLVHGLGYRYRKNVPALPGKPDLVFVGRQKVIFVHGCFWHRHRCALGRMPKSRLEFWKPKLEGNRARDARNARRLKSDGWRLLVIWECQIRNTQLLARRVREFLDA
jgi:DNA mismatch endonuclease (patch repair protein)